MPSLSGFSTANPLETTLLLSGTHESLELRAAASIGKQVVYFGRQGGIESSGTEGLQPLTGIVLGHLNPLTRGSALTLGSVSNEMNHRTPGWLGHG